MTHILAKQLDELMGVNRNGDRSNLIIKDFTDKRVCRYDLCGLCPYKLFPNTKQDLGKCPYEMCPVPDKFKKKYQDERKKHDFGYERELEQILERLQRECDERIARHQRRLEVQQKNQVTNEPVELQSVRQEVEDMTKQIEDLTNEGEIDKANELMEKLEAKRKEKEQLETKLPNAKEQQLIVCEVCAALLSVNESDQRLADHFAGKMHLGFQKIRDKLKELRENRSFEDKRQRDTDRARGHRRGTHEDDDFEREYDERKKKSSSEEEYSSSGYARGAAGGAASNGSGDHYHHHHYNSSRDNYHYHGGRGGNDYHYHGGGGGSGRGGGDYSQQHYHGGGGGGGRGDNYNSNRGDYPPPHHNYNSRDGSGYHGGRDRGGAPRYGGGGGGSRRQYDDRYSGGAGGGRYDKYQ